MNTIRRRIPAVAALLLACSEPPPPCPEPVVDTGPAAPAEQPPTAEDAAAFVTELEAELLERWVDRERAEWIKANFITHDTDLVAAREGAALMELVGRKAREATRFTGLALPEDVERKLDLLKVALDLPAPADAAQRDELAGLAAKLESAYGKGEHCFTPEGAERPTCRDLGDLSRVMAESRDHLELLDAWRGWRTVSPPMRGDYRRFVELANAGAVELGFGDLGDLWKSRYDMHPDQFQAQLDHLWEQVRPLYEELHCYVRSRLAEQYGSDVVESFKPIPAHLLGNMWSQEWNNIYDLVVPEEGEDFDVTGALKKHRLGPVKMVRRGEAFFSSLGFEPLPETFWERSLFTRPRDRDVVCHASAWDVDWKEDLRIKMCIEVTAEDFTTIHHELGHIYYFRAYKDQPPLFTNSANDGFHEALGDLIALSVTPGYFQEIGLIDKPPRDTLNPLMQRALEKVAFLPFGLVVDRWRFDVFSGKVPPEKYNEHWWELRKQYQGVAAPIPRSKRDFDPGAKYHIPANVPYTRYFLASILQFQFHRALCRQAGHEGPLHTCSIYGNKEVGGRIDEMMKLGSSQPWPEALAALTGEEQVDATAIIDYFEPLLLWLKEKNRGTQCGW